MKTLINKEFELESVIYAQEEKGAVVVEIRKQKSLFSDIAYPLVKLVPEDKKTDLEYLVKAQLVLSKIKNAEPYSEIELEDDHFKLLLSCCEKFAVAFVCDGAIELM